MADFTKEEATTELRWLTYPIQRGPAPFDLEWRETLQQKYRVTRGEGGKVEYSEEWRDIPEVKEGQK